MSAQGIIGFIVCIVHPNLPQVFDMHFFGPAEAGEAEKTFHIFRNLADAEGCKVAMLTVNFRGATIFKIGEKIKEIQLKVIETIHMVDGPPSGGPIEEPEHEKTVIQFPGAGNRSKDN